MATIPANPTPPQVHPEPAVLQGYAGFSAFREVVMQIRMPLRLKPDLEASLRAASDELDEVMAAISLGIRDQQQFDALEQRVQRIGSTLRQAFRGGH